MNNGHDEIDLIVLLDYICTSKDHKCNFNMNNERTSIKEKCTKSIIKLSLLQHLPKQELWYLRIILKLFV